MLAEGANPARRVASRKAGEDPATREMIEHCDIFGELHRIDCRQIHAQLPDAHRLGVLGYEIVPEQRVWRGFDSGQICLQLSTCDSGTGGHIADQFEESWFVEPGDTAFGPGRDDLYPALLRQRLRFVDRPEDE